MARFSWPGLFKALRRARSRPEEGSEAPAPVEGPLVWCHANNADQAAAFAEAGQRVAEEYGELNFLLSAGSDDAWAALSATPLPGWMRTRRLAEENGALNSEKEPPRLVVWGSPPDRLPLLDRLVEQGARMVLADAREPPGSRPLLHRLPGLHRASLSRFDLILAADPPAARWLNGFGLGPGIVELSGPMRHGVAFPPADQQEHARIAALIPARPVWLSVGVTPKEEDWMLEAHRKALRSAHRLLLVLIPAKPEDGPDIARRCEAAGLAVACQSEGHEPDPETQVYIADETGEPWLWYRLSPITFIGGTLAHGQPVDPYGPAALGSAVLHGPHTGHCREMFARLDRAEAAIPVSDSGTLAQAVATLLAPDQAARVAHNGWIVVSEGAQAVNRLVEIISEALDAGGAEA